MEDPLISGLGKRIKQLRQGKNQKLTDLAQIAGISKGLLSKIENGRAIPSLPVLFSLIRSLEIQPDVFFNHFYFEEPVKYLHKKPNDYFIIKKEDGVAGFNYWFLFEKVMENFALEAVILDIEPGAQRKKIKTNAYEFKFILEGTIHYYLDEECILLEKGDCFFFDGNIPHVPLNKSDAIAKMLVLYCYYTTDEDR